MDINNCNEDNKYTSYSSFYDLAQNKSMYYDYKTAAEKMLKYLPSKGFVLELGVGTGLFLEQLVKIAPPGLQFVGIDHTQEMIDIAIGRLGHFENIELLCADACKIQLDHKFDIAVSHGGVWVFLGDVFLSHIHDEKKNILALERLRAHMQEDGEVIINIQPMHKRSYTQMEGGFSFREEVELSYTESIKDYFLEENGKIIGSQRCRYKLWRGEAINHLLNQAGFGMESENGCEQYNILKTMKCS